ncbi:MAG: hypothetical protein DI568_13550 [Sphingomonas sp.]|nr:MAG: hypothetical protein DI568_13550 [Sphingomonas sp.]
MLDRTFVRRTIRGEMLVRGSALALLVSGAAQAQQIVVGSPACPIVDGVATCTGDMSGGITSQQTQGHAAVSTIIVRDLTGPIAPAGVFGIGSDRGDGSVRIEVADDVVINTLDNMGIVEPAQGIILLVRNGHDASIDTGATIAANGLNNGIAGVEAVVFSGDSNASITNRGAVSVSTTADVTSVALLATSASTSGSVTIGNSGALSASSGGSGERVGVTAGILARRDTAGGQIRVTNSGVITVRPAAATSDTDFAGMAAGIVTNSYVSGGDTEIVNSGAIDALGQATHGIVGFAQGNVATDATAVRITNSGSLKTDGTDTYGILAQGRGEKVDLSVTNGAEGAIALHNASNSNGIFMLNQARAGSSTLNNEAAISAESGESSRALGISTSGAPAGGNYQFNVNNNGAITLNTDQAMGITLFATRDDTVTATVRNSGNMNLTAATISSSLGISANLLGAGTGTGETSLTLENSGTIAMGAGTALTLAAKTITATNSGALTTTGSFSDVVRLTGSGEGSAISFTTTADVIATGANSDAFAVNGTGGTASVILDGADASTAADSAVLRVTGSVATTFTVRNGGGVTGDLLFADGADRLVLESGGTLLGDVDFGGGNDQFTLGATGFRGAISLGAGDDTLVLQAPTVGTINFIDYVDGGTGNDVLELAMAAGSSSNFNIAGLDVRNVDTIAQTGNASITYTGSSSIATRYELRQGSLIHNATTATIDVVTSAGTSLALSGQLRNLTVGGDFAPGGAGSIGTATVLGNFTSSTGSRTLIDILANGTGDLIDVTGTATLSGGTVVVTSISPESAFEGDLSIAILRAGGGVTGTFAGLDSSALPFLELSLAYAANSVSLVAALPDEVPAFAPVAQTFNQRQVATAIDAHSQEASGDLETVVDAIILSNTGQALTAFDSSSGEIHASVLASGVRQGRLLIDGMMNRTATAAAPEGSGWKLGGYLSAGLSDGSISGDGNAGRVKSTRYGFALGVDMTDAATGSLIGLSGGYSTSDVDVSARQSSADLKAWFIGGYGRFGNGFTGFTASGALAWGSGDADTSRGISVNSLSRTARASYTVDTFAAAAELRYGIAPSAGWAVGPIATLEHVKVNRDGFQESGASSLDLTGGSDNASATAWGLGGFAGWQGATGRVSASLRYDRSNRGYAETALQLAGTPGTSHLVRSPDTSRDAAVLDVSGGVALGSGWALSAGYRGRYGSDSKTHDALISLTFQR